jgi:hypothetical protein
MPLAIPSGTLLTALFNPAIPSFRSERAPGMLGARWFATASRNSRSPGWLTSGSMSDVCVSTYSPQSLCNNFEAVGT